MDIKWLMKHTVDLDRSEIDKSKSDPKKGKFTFIKKVYIQQKDYKNAETQPKYVLRWISKDEDDALSGMSYWQGEYGAEPVTAGVDPYWPETKIPDEEGHYVQVDSILVKVPTRVWIEKILADRARYDKAARGLQKSFQDQARAANAGLDDVEF
jgi:hypothetical protein